MEDIKILTTVDEVRTFSDPYRLQILQTFFSFGAPATVKQVADRMKEVPANVYYHVKKLEKVGILTLVHTENINGIIAKYYEPSASKYDIGVRNVEEPAMKLLISEAQKTVCNLYEESKNTVLNELNKLREREHGSLGFNATMETLYLTEEQLKELCKYISNFCESNNKKVDGKKSYHFFSMVGEIK